MDSGEARRGLRIRCKQARRQKSMLSLTATIGVLLLVSSFSPPLVSSVDHIEISDLDGAQAAQIPSTSAPFSGQNPFAWATTFENNRSVTSDHGKLELACTVTSANLSSTCISHLALERLAFIEPIFTTSAYQMNGFYAFYKLHARNITRYVTSDLSLLNVSVVDGWGGASGLLAFIQTYEEKGYFGRNTPILTDVGVNNGSLFYANGS